MSRPRFNTSGWMMFSGVLLAVVGLILLTFGGYGGSAEAVVLAERGVALMVLGALVGLVGWLLDLAGVSNT